MFYRRKVFFVVLAVLFIGAVSYFYAEYGISKPGHVSRFSGIKNSNGTLVGHDSKMLFAGDIMLSRSVGDLMERRGDYDLPFVKIADTLKSADLAFANLENPVSLRGTNVGSMYSFRADPKVLQGLQYAGFDVVNIANNHIWDYGAEAFLDTLKYVKDAGIDYIGAGYNFNEAHDGIIKDIKGVKVAFLGYTDLISSRVSATEESAGIAFLDLEQMAGDIKKAKSKSNIVVVSFHWGEEYQTKHNQKQEQIAEAAIDAGASLVIGHHPHVAQEVEKYKDGWIAYSLGNFVFDQNFSQETTHGLILETVIADGKIKSVNKKEVAISGEYQPKLVK